MPSNIKTLSLPFKMCTKYYLFALESGFTTKNKFYTCIPSLLYMKTNYKKNRQKNGWLHPKLAKHKTIMENGQKRKRDK